MEETTTNTDIKYDDAKKAEVPKEKILRCMDWLQKQNNLEPTKLSLQNKNDIQFIIQTNAERKNFLLAAAEDEATVPAGVNEPCIEPKLVSLHKLRVKDLLMECEWPTCKNHFSDYNEYQKHVWKHASDVKVLQKDDEIEYACLWDTCGHKTLDYKEMVRHINYHAYHGKLLAIGFNGRATLKLMQCKKDSKKRNQFSVQGCDYKCMWTNCEETFNSMQNFLDHVKIHTAYTETFLCSWAGCGSQFTRRVLFVGHVRTHTGERLIACYHCGQHFANNRKLCDHMKRQNVYPNSPYVCEYCGTRCATEYLLGEHARAHVSTWACSLCDMSAASRAALAQHMRYRHLDHRPHQCPHCVYKAISKSDLRTHILRHTKKMKAAAGLADSDDEGKKKSPRKYVCHMCPEKQMKIFSRGFRLTTHLVKVHGAQWSFGHSRFRYQICADGMYRLTTTRFESLEVSKKIMDNYSGPTESLANLKFKFKKVADATEKTPRHFVIELNNDKDDGEENMDVDEKIPISDEKGVEITMCDVDDKGNIICSETIKSEVVYN